MAAQEARAGRGATARARLHGQLAGLLGIPRMGRKRRTVQRSRTVDRAYIERVLTGVDESA